MRVSYILISLYRKTAGEPPSFLFSYFLSCSHFWLATEQEVLLADWQEVWHSPQPPFFADSQRFLELNVLILFIGNTSFKDF